MVLDNNANVDAKTANMRTPLHLACIRGRLDFAKLLLAKGANLNMQDIEGNTPLHYVSEYGHREMLVVLLTNNISKYQPDLKIRNA